MRDMFDRARSFNQSLNNWDTSNVVNMSWMFANAESFNQPLNEWNVSKVRDMKFMFDGGKELEINKKSAEINEF